MLVFRLGRDISLTVLTTLFLLFSLLLTCSMTFAQFPIAKPGTEGLEVVVSGTGSVIAIYQGNSATYSNDLYLVAQPGTYGDTFVFNNHESPVGSTKNLGTFPIGTKLIFRLHVRDTGRDYFTGTFIRNPDDKPHARAQADWKPNETLVSFEDLFNGPFDYNDLSFSFIPTTAPPTPYAAIAFSPSLKAVREGFGSTAEEAQAVAINACLKYANDNLAEYYRDCAPYAWVHNGFVALASSGRAPRELDWGWGSGWGHTPEQAAQEAVVICQSVGGGGPGKAPCLQVGGSPFRSPVYDPSQPSPGGPPTVNWSTAPLPRTDLSVQQINPTVIRLTWRNPSSDVQTAPSQIEINNGNESWFVDPSSTSYDRAVRPDEYMCFHVRAINDIGWSWWEPNVDPWYRCAGHIPY